MFNTSDETFSYFRVTIKNHCKILITRGLIFIKYNIRLRYCLIFTLHKRAFFIKIRNDYKYLLNFTALMRALFKKLMVMAKNMCIIF